MPVISPATTNVGSTQNATDRAQWSVNRITDPVRVGKTLFKVNGVWQCQLSPSQRQLEGADYVFLGGHTYTISDALLAEIQAAVGDECQPDVSVGVTPSSTTFPSSHTFPGVD